MGEELTADAMARLGEKIVAAARLAVAMHLFQSVTGDQNVGQRIVIGGAGPAWSEGHARPVTQDASPEPSEVRE